MESIESLKIEIEQIKQRNKRVELDKAWETSWTRKLLLAFLTYFVIVLFFYIAGLARPFINAIVPTCGFLISTFTVPVVKKIWVKNQTK
ncbi:hypothetical protein KKG46_04565 [Patescibacteria group bacterium]|nr:hypothetical protein [Patescibacteria group bacterium]